MRRGAISGLALRPGDDEGARQSREFWPLSPTVWGARKRANDSFDVSKELRDCLTACVWGCSQPRVDMDGVPWFAHSRQFCITCI